MKSDNLSNLIESNADVTAMQQDYRERFKDLGEWLTTRLIDNISDIALNKEEDIIGDELFRRLEGVPLIDKYDAYQLLDEEWTKISGDIEIIKEDGVDAVRTVDPNMVVTKKDGKTIEKQDGWKGRILPFDFVQSTYFRKELDNIHNKENESSEKQSIISDILEGLTEDEKEEIKDSCLNEDDDAFNASGLASYVKPLTKKGTKYPEDSLEARLISADKAFKADKEIKKEVKALREELEDKTIGFIKGQSDEDIRQHLYDKWIAVLCSEIASMPATIIKSFEDKTKKLSEKYSVTYRDIEAQIKETSLSLASMINDLTGNDYDMTGLREFQKILEG